VDGVADGESYLPRHHCAAEAGKEKEGMQEARRVVAPLARTWHPSGVPSKPRTVRGRPEPSGARRGQIA
jgi:hypothetical protein